MSDILKISQKTSAKENVCCGCGCKIFKGEQYAFIFEAKNNMASTHKMCTNCGDAFEKITNISELFLDDSPSPKELKEYIEERLSFDREWAIANFAENYGIDEQSIFDILEKK